MIPDAHVNQGQDLNRFKYIKRLLSNEYFHFLLIIGDFVGMNALSHWDKNKRVTMEGRRYKADMDAGNRALDAIDFFSRDKYYLEGNHEAWAKKFVEENPSMEGFVDPFINLSLAERGYNITPYKEYLDMEGIQFTHVPLKGGVPVQGNYVMQRAFEVVAKSTIFGHTHRFETMNGRRLGEDRLIQLATIGCFFEEDYEADFLKGCPNPYWRGVVAINIYEPGHFDLEQISLSRLARL